jgi:hypothetical protein
MAIVDFHRIKKRRAGVKSEKPGRLSLLQDDASLASRPDLQSNEFAACDHFLTLLLELP